MGCGKILALDWGEVRVGWALSDATQTLPGQSGTLYRGQPESDLSAIQQLIEREAVVAVVVGIPYNMDGSLGPQAQATLEVVAELGQRLNVPVRQVDERLTSAEAERVMLDAGLSRKRRKQKRDALAAMLILQTYLSQQNA